MLRIVKILSMASLGLAALTAVYVLVKIVQGGEESEYLSLPGAVELYEQRAGNIKPTTETESPLAKAAKLFVFGQIPPPPPVKETAVVKGNETPQGPLEAPKDEVKRPAGLTAKFKLIATACYTSVPEKSLALLELTSAGSTPTTKWVRIGDAVEGFTVHEISENALTLYQGDKPNSTVEMAQTPTIFPSILKGDPDAGRPVVSAASIIPPTEKVDLPPNMTARDMPKLLEKHSLEAIQAAAAATQPASTGPRTIFSTDPAASDSSGTGAITAGAAKSPTAATATDARAASRRGAYRPPVPPTRTIPNAPVKTPAPPPTPEAQKAELDRNIEDIRKLMGTPNPNASGADPSEDQKAWGELLKLLEEERRNVDAAANGAATGTTPAPTPPVPTPPTPQPETPAPSTPPASTPSSPPAPADAPPADPPSGDNPPANTDNGGN